ncbi:hypothetical protein DNU06_04135 [Putridiphycobacter roseus]|uniref:Transcriptional repressor n=1 Tax=Putridiphycobacter roseus TaxID=2219161 RepID=A0A2W1NIP0_9FLAO|nr:transcriptional repressor [Putridiphycobacter roseus]PZE17816.1 hypothetical protein DNU06_04135 [Putridiphycobacter roseus]
MENLLTKKNIRVTDFRTSVLEIFLKYKNAISITVIEENLEKYDRITLYRTIKTFLKKGLIHEINVAGESTKLALCGQECMPDNHQHNHLHFHCNQCLNVYCLPIPDPHKVELKNFKIDEYEIIASGTCNNCLNQTNLSS